MSQSKKTHPKYSFENDDYMIIDKFEYYEYIGEPKPWGDAADIIVDKLNGKVLHQFSCRAEMEKEIQNMKVGKGTPYRDIYRDISKKAHPKYSFVEGPFKNKKAAEDRMHQLGYSPSPCPGGKIRSKGKGQGLGIGKGKGPIKLRSNPSQGTELWANQVIRSADFKDWFPPYTPIRKKDIPELKKLVVKTIVNTGAWYQADLDRKQINEVAEYIVKYYGAPKRTPVGGVGVKVPSRITVSVEDILKDRNVKLRNIKKGKAITYLNKKFKIHRIYGVYPSTQLVDLRRYKTSRVGSNIGLETITTMGVINTHREAKQCIPAGSYLHRKDGELTVVKDGGGRKFWFIWKGGKPKKHKKRIAPTNKEVSMSVGKTRKAQLKRVMKRSQQLRKQGVKKHLKQAWREEKGVSKRVSKKVGKRVGKKVGKRVSSRVGEFPPDMDVNDIID